jgi:hypothetical protein
MTLTASVPRKLCRGLVRELIDIIFWRLDHVTATSFSLANKEFQGIFEELVPKVFEDDYTFPLDIHTLIRCEDKWKAQVSLKVTLMGWFPPAGL